MTDPWNEVDEVLALAWELLAATPPGTGGRRVTFMTNGLDGVPQGRTVVLRGADRVSGTLRFYTDVRSNKVAEIRHSASVGLVFWDEPAQAQLRVSGTAEVTSGPSVAHLWEELTDRGRLSYAHDPAPGDRLGAPGGFELRPMIDHFAVITVTVNSIEAVSLADKGHRRLLLDRGDPWRGIWLSP